MNFLNDAFPFIWRLFYFNFCLPAFLFGGSAAAGRAGREHWAVLSKYFIGPLQTGNVIRGLITSHAREISLGPGPGSLQSSESRGWAYRATGSKLFIYFFVWNEGKLF